MRQTSLSAQAQAVANPNPQVRAPGGRAEHISIESEPDPMEATMAPPHAAVCSSFTVASPLRGGSTQVSLLEDHFVAVHCVDRHRAPLEYVLDLRFANPKPVRARHVAWNWLSTALVMLALGGLAMWIAAGPSFLVSAGFGIGLACMLATTGALLKFARDTTESLQFVSEHGAAVLINITGSLGATRHGNRFFVELIRSIRAAKQVRPQPKAQWLRDEMREHTRLRELQVMSEADYEAGKARIFKAYA